MSGPLGSHELMYATSSDFYTYKITNCLRLNGTDQALEKTWGQAATTNDKFAISVWVKRAGADGTNSEFGSTTNTKLWSASSGNGAASDMLEFNTNNPSGYSDSLGYYQTNSGAAWTLRRFRDPSAWYQIVYIFDSTQGTATNRIKIYINGDQEPLTTDTNYWDLNGAAQPTQNADSTVGQNGNELHIGRYVYDDAGWWGGLMADFICIDGAAAISDFGEDKNGVWIPKDPSGLTFGNNGFWLKFTNSSAFGEDYSGNDNDFAHIGTIATHDQLTDSPTNNFCSINTVYRGDQTTDAKYGVVSEGNLTHKYSGSTDGQRPCTHKTPASGKWYFEYRIDGGGGTGDYSPAAGIIDPNTYTMNSGNYNDTGSVQYTNNENKVRKDGSIVGTYGGSRGSNGDVMGIAVDLDNGAFYVSKNGTYQAIDGGSTGDPTSGASRTGAGATWTPADAFTSGMIPLSAPTGGSAPIITLNFGQNGTFNGGETAGGNADANGNGNFFTAPPTDYLAICSENLPAPSTDPAEEDGPKEYFNTLLYTGNGQASQAQTGLGFQPDCVWIKTRNYDAGWRLFDSNRGATQALYLHNTDAEVDANDSLISFDSDGFTVGNNAGTGLNNKTAVAWCWKINGGTTATNSNGTLNCTQQVNSNAGMTISTYTGNGQNSTIGHGLSTIPDISMFRERGTAGNWIFRIKGDGNDNNLYPQVTNATSDGNYFQDTAATASVISIGTHGDINGSGQTYVMWNWESKEGFSKHGLYEGNGNADGTFVYLGFKPAFLMLKSLDSTSGWFQYDDKREGYNVDNDSLEWDVSTVEQTDDQVDLLSNGFKLRTSSDPNIAETFIYMAFASEPFKYATAR